MRKSASLWVVLLVLTGCGGGDAKPSDGQAPASRAKDAVVIRAWVDALRKGNYARANAQFATPSLIQNGGPAITLKTPRQVDAFNRSLPCGAELLDTQEVGDHRTLGIFRLTTASDGRTCRGAAGHRARVSFLIDSDHHIKEWIRVANGPPAGSTQA